jgi:hypothetical protein
MRRSSIGVEEEGSEGRGVADGEHRAAGDEDDTAGERIERVHDRVAAALTRRYEQSRVMGSDWREAVKSSEFSVEESMSERARLSDIVFYAFMMC